MSKWYVDKGEQGDIVLSTRVRLARNLEEFPFPCRLDTASRIKVNEKFVTPCSHACPSWGSTMSQWIRSAVSRRYLSPSAI